MKFTVEPRRQHLPLALLPAITERLSHAMVLQNLPSELASPLSSQLFLNYMTEHPCFPAWLSSRSSPLFSTCQQRQTWGTKVKCLESTVSCQACKGGLSQKLILSISSSSRNLLRWGEKCVSALDFFFFLFLQYSFCREMKLMYKAAFFICKGVCSDKTTL